MFVKNLEIEVLTDWEEGFLLYRKKSLYVF